MVGPIKMGTSSREGEPKTSQTRMRVGSAISSLLNPLIKKKSDGRQDGHAETSRCLRMCWCSVALNDRLHSQPAHPSEDGGGHVRNVGMGMVEFHEILHMHCTLWSCLQRASLRKYVWDTSHPGKVEGNIEAVGNRFKGTWAVITSWHIAKYKKKYCRTMQQRYNPCTGSNSKVTRHWKLQCGSGANGACHRDEAVGMLGLALFMNAWCEAGVELCTGLLSRGLEEWGGAWWAQRDAQLHTAFQH